MEGSWYICQCCLAKGAASSDAIATNGCIKRFSVPTIPPTPRWVMWRSLPGNTTRRRGGRRRKTAGRGQIRGKRQQYEPGGLRWRTRGGTGIRRGGGRKKEDALLFHLFMSCTRETRPGFNSPATLAGQGKLHCVVLDKVDVDTNCTSPRRQTYMM